MIGRLAALIAGIAVAGVKGLLIPLREPELLRPRFGLYHPRVSEAIDGLRAEPWRWTHHLTNVAVEWTRGEPQRAAKVIAIGWFVAMIGWVV